MVRLLPSSVPRPSFFLRRALLACPIACTLGFAAWNIWSRTTEGRFCSDAVESELTHYREEAARHAARS